MNEIQSKLLEIAKEYIEVCEKLNLRYFALGGTALGAMRHNGFIPWDDDIDFCMPREDYEKFCNEAQKHFPDHYFIQTHYTDKHYYCQYAKLRDSNTTAIEKAVKDVKMNHGLWIDIFPLDGLPVSDKKKKRLDFIDFKLLRRRYQSYKYKLPQFHIKVANFLIKILLPSKHLAYKSCINKSKKYPFENSEYIWWMFEKRCKLYIKREWFDNYKMHQFEDIQIRVPVECEKYLEGHYGNWKQFPPEEDRKPIHSIIVLDLNKSYKEYAK